LRVDPEALPGKEIDVIFCYVGNLFEVFFIVVVLINLNLPDKGITEDRCRCRAIIYACGKASIGASSTSREALMRFMRPDISTTVPDHAVKLTATRGSQTSATF
jgi:hypothetical protein